MKFPTSWTAQQTMRKCPARFKYRYREPDPTGYLLSLKNLHSVRELGGQVIHEVLANCVRSIADGARISDFDSAPATALKEYALVVERSQRIDPGLFHGGRQLAETFNGVACAAEIADWTEIIPHAVRNGLRLMRYFKLRPNKDRYRLEAEQRNSFNHRGSEHRFVIDVLIDDGFNVSVIDWKCHYRGATDSDLHQVALYQRYLLKDRNIPPTRLYGFVANLLDEEVIEHHYRAIENTFAPIHVPSRMSTGNGLIHKPPLVDPYPARPSTEACSVCAFASVCPDSALRLAISEQAPPITIIPKEVDCGS